MLESINMISHFGRFDYIIPENTSNIDNLKKVILIYALNGSGKTSLSLIGKSIAERNNNLINKKKDRFSNSSPEIKLNFSGENVNFKKNKWDSLPSKDKIKIFNSYFVENNIYTYEIDENGFNFREIIPDIHKNELRNLEKNINKLTKRIHIRKHKSKLARQAKKQNYSVKVNVSDIKLKEYKHIMRNEVNYKYKTKTLIKRNESLKSRYKFLYQKYVLNDLQTNINSYLNNFNVEFNINMSDVIISWKYDINRTYTTIRLIFDLISIYNGGKSLIYNEKNGYRDSFDFRLSDGDKSSLSFSLYVSLLKMIPDIENQILFIDDPFTSMDDNRQFETKRILSRLAKKANQIIITSHKKDFIYGVYDELINDQYDKNKILCSEIYTEGKYSKFESLSINRLDTIEKKYISFLEYAEGKKVLSKNNVRDVVMNIRPFLESILKIKFPTFYVYKQTWLGVYLSYIKQSTKKEYMAFDRLRPYLDDFEDILSYTQSFNHRLNNNNYSIKESLQIIKKAIKLFEVI